MKPLKFVITACALAVGITTAITTTSADDKKAKKEQIEFGQYLSSSCVTCHKLDGKDTGIPSIIGWDEESFVEVLLSFKTKERENKAMQTVAATLSKTDMAALAAYYATIKEKE